MRMPTIQMMAIKNAVFDQKCIARTHIIIVGIMIGFSPLAREEGRKSQKHLTSPSHTHRFSLAQLDVPSGG
jgi:hypothetical protein